jgi:ketosteroid isomerase-like protein
VFRPSRRILVEKNRAAVEIPFHDRHRGTDTVLETTKANFWTWEDGRPVRLTEYYDVAKLQAFFGPWCRTPRRDSRFAQTT